MRVRRLRADEADALRDLRLRALQDGRTTERGRPAAALYRALGFVPTGERRGLESDPDLETIVMTWTP